MARKQKSEAHCPKCGSDNYDAMVVDTRPRLEDGKESPGMGNPPFGIRTTGTCFACLHKHVDIIIRDGYAGSR